VNIVAVGECTRDRYLDSVVDAVGGISLNFAITARRCGAGSVAIVSCIGVDDAADSIRERLAREDVDTTHLHALPGATASQAIRIAAAGERTFPAGGYDAGVLATFHLDADDVSFIGTFDVVVAPYFRQIKQLFYPAMQAATARAKRVADLLDGEDLGPDLSGLDPLLDTLDVAFISGNEETVELLLPRSRETRTLLVVTHGADGSSALASGIRHFEPAVVVPIVERIDTTGCGDAFQAAFTVEYFRCGDISLALHAGAARAATVIRHLGATEA
jgi:fructoselysine 6-kinase